MDSYAILCDSTESKWLGLRKTGIGASEMAAVLGESPYKSALELYVEKTTDIKEDTDNRDEWKRWGNKLEGIIIEEYATRTQRITMKSGELLRSTKYPWAICTLDAWVWIDDVGVPLEIKTTSSFRAEEWIDGPPEMYRIQCHHQMLVTDSKSASIACLIGGQKFVWADVERDETLINRIIAAGNAFWEKVQNKVPPEPDGSESAHRALSIMHPIETIHEKQLSGDFIDLDTDLEKLKKEAKLIDRQIEAKKQAIQAALGDSQIGVLPNGVIYTYLTARRPETVMKASQYRVLRRKAPKGK